MTPCRVQILASIKAKDLNAGYAFTWSNPNRALGHKSVIDVGPSAAVYQQGRRHQANGQVSLLKGGIGEFARCMFRVLKRPLPPPKLVRSEAAVF